MSEKRLSEQDYSNTQRRFEELKRLLADTWVCANKNPVYADWLRHEAKGHNPLAEGIVLYGLDATESWDFVLKHYGLTKAQAFRRRLQEAKEAFDKSRK